LPDKEVTRQKADVNAKQQIKTATLPYSSEGFITKKERRPKTLKKEIRTAQLRGRTQRKEQQMKKEEGKFFL
jgi:hypothetical protein